MGKWKAVRLNVFKAPDGDIELYDLSTDPKETQNLAARNPLVVKQIREIMQKSHIENADFPFLQRK